MKRVAILVETALASGRSILGGISQYLQEHDDWSVFHPTGQLGATEVAGLEQWDGDGIIVRLSTPTILELVKEKGVPAVDVLGNVENSPFPLVKSDDQAIGKLVADHFFNNGHRHFAFLGLSAERWSLERESAFKKTLEKHDQQAVSYHLDPEDQGPDRWQKNLREIISWLDALPKPFGLMVASDQFGPLVLKACERAGLTVPEEVSVVGVDNDLPFCELCRPRLSSVEPDHVRVGYEAARLLDKLIDGETPSTRQIETPPLKLYSRASSDSMAVNDPFLVKAMHCIREQACRGISVDEIAAQAGLSRSVLQRRFREQLGRTVGDVILSVKLRRARDMLTYTQLPLIDVAERSGFNYQEYLTYIFKKHLHTTPARYRAQSSSK